MCVGALTKRIYGETRINLNILKSNTPINRGGFEGWSSVKPYKLQITNYKSNKQKGGFVQGLDFFENYRY